MSIVLPLSEWEIISNKVDTCEPLNPLERFVYENLPAGEDEQLFYIQLRNALEYVVESAIKSPNSDMVPCPRYTSGNYRCRVGFKRECGDKPCLLAQHQ